MKEVDSIKLQLTGHFTKGGACDQPAENTDAPDIKIFLDHNKVSYCVIATIGLIPHIT